MFRIGKSFAFSASHQLTHLPDDHPCARLHGHNYVVTMILEAEEVDDKTGFVRDFKELDLVKRHIDAVLDHRDLNEVFNARGKDGWQVTSENIARYFWLRFNDAFPELVCVRVAETEKSFAEYWGRVWER